MKKATWKSGICFFIINALLSCTSKDNPTRLSEPSFLPPDEHEIATLKGVSSWETLNTEKNQNKKWWLQLHWSQMYLQDQNQIATACRLLEELYLEKKFPLHPYAGLLLKARCPDKAAIDISLSEKQKVIYKKWTREIELAQAVQTNNQENRFVLLMELNADEKDRFLRKETYLKLLNEAKRLKNDSLVNLVSSELKKEFPQYLEDLQKNYYEISLDLIKDRSFPDALRRLNTLVHDKSVRAEQKFRSFKTMFRIYKSTQNKTDQWSLIERWGKWIKTQKKVAEYESWLNEWEILKARWLWTESQTSKAIEILASYENRKIRNSLKEEASYTLGRIYDEKKDYEKAKRLYQNSHDQSPLKKEALIKAKNSLYEKNLWSLAWLEYKNKKYEDSRKWLQEIVDKLGGESDSKYLYWLAQSYRQLGQDDLFKTTLINLRKKEPLSFYTLLSYRDLREPIPLLKKSSLTNKREFLVENLKNNLAELEIAEILWLISLEQNEILQNWAKVLEKEALDNYLPILLLYSQSGQYQNLLNSIQALSSEQKNTITYQFPELLFPKPYFDEVQKNSQLQSVPMSFVYSIMRQESAFNPYARSSVDALGLLQLMPNLAKKLAAGESINYRNEFDLFDPAINIALGTKELKNLLTHYQNRFIPAISGYNASSAAYKGWIQVRGRDNVVEFIEEIPYEETRTYIKLILRNMLFYERIYFQNQPFEFPAQWLEK
ncbi:MAG: lytic transglycosylase domain-containing protein [Bdellovibrionaceae bacterium]|nr:lytic transglycosylase domain-containing protein [Pseudobdellovibrionaceae bacterium]